MTANEIKKAFEIFKKEIAKECGFKGGFTMSKKQIELRTATFLVNNTISFEEEIKKQQESDERVQGFDTWTDEQKAKHHEYCMDNIRFYEKQKAKWGTKANEFSVKMKMLEESKAFANLQQAIGNINLTAELKEGMFNYIRFNY